MIANALISLAMSISVESRILPYYPQDAVDGGYEASCTIVFDLEADGMTENVCAACAVYPEAPMEIGSQFEDALEHAALRWRYNRPESATQNFRAPFYFQLDPDASDIPGPAPSACPERTNQSPEHPTNNTQGN